MLDLSRLKDDNLLNLKNIKERGYTKMDSQDYTTDTYKKDEKNEITEVTEYAIQKFEEVQQIELLDEQVTITKYYEFIAKTVVSTVKDLPRNPHSKNLFDAYAKEATYKNQQVWTIETNQTITENMLKDGRTPQRIVDALKHSPKPVKDAYYFVKEIRNSLGMLQTKQSKGVVRGIINS